MPEHARGVAVAGGHAYVAALGSGLQVIDISTPEQPWIVGSVQTPFAWRVAVSGNTAYVGNYYAGLEVIDLGVDVPNQKFVEIADRVDVIALSSLLTTTMPNMKSIIADIEAAGKRGKTRVIVGGAPVTAEYAAIIGADGYASDASRAVNLVKSLIGK
jgi:hypothetical protein